MRRILWLIALLCCVLTGCGFHLRGSMPLSPPLHNLYLKTKDPYGPLARNLRDYFRYSHVPLASSPQNASAVLEILNVTQSQNLLNVSGTQLTRQYNLVLTVNFQVTDTAGKVLIAPQEVSETRVITIESDQILGGSNEASTMYKQMHQAIVYDMINRLGSREISTLLAEREQAERKHHT